MEIRPLREADSEAISTWRYPGRYATYDIGDVARDADASWVVWDAGELVGHCCFGAEARVPGVNEEDGTVDVGYGMRPDLVGKGLGGDFVSAILDFAVAEFSPRQLRLLILTWNERSRKVAQALGFEIERTIRSAEGEFFVLVRPATS